MHALAASFLFIVLLSSYNAIAAHSSDPVYGRKLYLYWCSQCHGLEGKGDGVNSTADMLVNPRDHTDAAYMSTRTDKQLEDVIRGGGVSVSKSPIMPPWSSTLSEQEIRAIVAYLRELCRCQFEGVISDEKLRTISPGFR